MSVMYNTVIVQVIISMADIMSCRQPQLPHPAGSRLTAIA